MKRSSLVCKRGQGLIGLLVVAIIVGYLYKQGLLKSVLTPATPKQLPVAEQTLPDMAAITTFKGSAQQVRAAVAQFQQTQYRLPKDLGELHRETGVDLMKDPWGGTYYEQQGYLRCTGNPKVWEKVW